MDAVLTGGSPRQPEARVIGYGGAAGGGKTDADLGLSMLWGMAYPGSSVAFFRRTYPELEGPDGAIMRSREMFGPLAEAGLVKYTGDNHRWTWKNGSILQFCHCKDPADVYNYQSQSFDLFIPDEATHFLWPMIDYLMTRNRPTVDCVIRPLAVMTTNPGNVGHLWYKTQYADLPPLEAAEVMLPSGETELHLFIPAKLADNPILDSRAGGQYRKDLLKRDPATRKALLDGDWDVFEGQAFGQFMRGQHTIPPFTIPAHWQRWRAVDWGYSAPWCCLWLAKDPDTGRVYVYRELYRAGLTDRQQAREIRAHTLETVAYTLADPSMWTKKNQEDKTFSTADEYAAEKVLLTKADNDRLTGKRKLNTLLDPLPDEKPGILVFETCHNLIRTLPALVYDKTNVEDVDTDGEDHAYDALRYGLTRVNPRPRPPLPAPLPKLDPVMKRAGYSMAEGRGWSKDW